MSMNYKEATPSLPQPHLLGGRRGVAGVTGSVVCEQLAGVTWATKKCRVSVIVKSVESPSAPGPKDRWFWHLEKLKK